MVKLLVKNRASIGPGTSRVPETLLSRFIINLTLIIIDSVLQNRAMMNADLSMQEDRQACDVTLRRIYRRSSYVHPVGILYILLAAEGIINFVVLNGQETCISSSISDKTPSIKLE